MFAIALFVLLVCTESAQEGSIISSVLFLSGLVLVGVATVGRLWCAMYISGYKGSELIVCGPYAMCRNPLYFFSLLGWVGVGLATETFSFGIVFVLAFWLVYPQIMKREEESLRSKFGDAFREYCARTPRFVPNPKAFHEPESYVVNPRVFRRAMGDALWFIWLVGIIELVEALHEYQFVTPVIRLP
ncbi:MAG: isoprenylcysteine carboxylmethyltransferase family protein [candidate division NC10 bacterium]|nr:isoprenylcysteine carboxylmethyltransferase family protein [candidate division NC10 bacterium]